MIERADLVNRVLGSGARLIRLVAPAGYGKSTLTRSLAPHFSVSVVCDCDGASSAGELAQRVVAALARENPKRSEALAQQTLAVGTDARAWEEFAAHAWTAEAPRSLFVFENAEQIARTEPMTELVGTLLAVANESRTVAICSRVPLVMPLGHVVAPHETLLLRTDALQLRDDEIRAVFAGLAVPEAALSRVQSVSRGWAIAVFLLARFAREQRLEEMLDKVDDVAFDDLHDYLTSEVLAELPADWLDALIACVALPRPTTEDVGVALDAIDAAALMRDLTAALPFLSRTQEGIYDVDPLLATTLRTRYSKRRVEILKGAAQAWADRGNHVRAAQMYLALGDREAAAGAAERLEPAYLEIPSIEFADVVATLDDETLARHPQLWSAAMTWRAGSLEPHDRIRQCQAVWRSLPADAPWVLRGSLAAAYFGALSNLGRVADAKRLLDEFEHSLDTTTNTGGRAVLDFLRIAVEAAYFGKYADVETVAARIYPMLAGSDISHAYFLAQILALMHAARGEFDAARNAMAEAIGFADRSNIPTVKATVLIHAVTLDWLSGDDELFERHLCMLEELTGPGIARFTDFIISAARGRAKDYRIGYERYEWRAIGYLMAAALEAEPPDRVRLCSLALHWADDSAQLLLRVLARVALGELVVSERRKLQKEAAEIAAGMESDPLQQAVAALRDGAGNFGMLEPFVARFRRDRAGTGRDRAPGDASLAGWPAEKSPLSKREREVAALIAQGKSNREIGEILVISERTVENHVASMFNKLGVGSRAALAAYVASQRTP